MARVILHIGTHKTGTTFVQNSFAANRTVLARHGVICPEIGRTAGHHALVTHWHDLPAEFRVDCPPVDLWHGLARFAKSDGVVFLSSEEFSRGDRRVDFAEIRRLLAPFERVDVVCILRHQLPFLQSIQLQITRAQARPEFPMLIAAARKTGYASGLFLDYGALYDFLLTAFALDQIHFIDYAQARRAPGGLMGAMLGLCGAPAALGALDLATMPAANVSPDPLAFWLARSQSAAGPIPAQALAAATATLRDRFGAGRRTTLFTRAEYQTLADHFAPLNAAFSARLRDVQPGFTLSTPDPLPANTLWREDVTALAQEARAPGADQT